MSISETDVRHIAALARVGLNDARIPSFVRELNGILEHMDVLQQVTLTDNSVDTSVNTNACHAESRSVLRSDLLPADALQRERESFAPAMRDGFFLVPRLTTHGALGASAEKGDVGDDT